MATTVPDPRRPDPTRLGPEVRQSLSLLGMMALTMLASIGIGILAGHVG